MRRQPGTLQRGRYEADVSMERNYCGVVAELFSSAGGPESIAGRGIHGTKHFRISKMAGTSSEKERPRGRGE